MKTAFIETLKLVIFACAVEAGFLWCLWCYQ